jgi:hypothetical protein
MTGDVSLTETSLVPVAGFIGLPFAAHDAPTMVSVIRKRSFLSLSPAKRVAAASSAPKARSSVQSSA